MPQTNLLHSPRDIPAPLPTSSHVIPISGRVRTSSLTSITLLRNVEISQVAETSAAKPITLLRLRDHFTWVSICVSLASSPVREPGLHVVRGIAPYIFLDITSSILLIAFMSLYFSILFLSIIILCPVCLCILYCAVVELLIASRSGIRNAGRAKTFCLSSPHIVLRRKALAQRWSSMISLFVMNAY